MTEFENTIIYYFTSDSARLVAPIKTVTVTANNGTAYTIVSDGSISLDGYPSVLLSSGASYGSGAAEDAAVLPTVDNETADDTDSIENSSNIPGVYIPAPPETEPEPEPEPVVDSCVFNCGSSNSGGGSAYVTTYYLTTTMTVVADYNY